MANATLGGSSRPLVPQPVIDSAAPSMAELVSCFILTPAEGLKQNTQMIRQPEGTESKSSRVFQSSVTLQALKHFKKPSQLWRGYAALVARNLPFTAMQFPMYEHLKKSIHDYRQRRGVANVTLSETAIITAVSAGSAGSTAAVITTLVDLVKTRIMLSAAGDSLDIETKGVDLTRARGQSADNLAHEERVTRKGGLTVAREVV